MSLKDINRFYSKTKLSNTGCLEWTGSKNPKGYGKFTVKFKDYRAHRFIFEQMAEELSLTDQVLHKCDNPSCVNIFHLFKGDNTINMRDKRVKNRSARHIGEKHPMVKLSDSQVGEIREFCLTRTDVLTYAARLNMSKSHIYAIRAMRTRVVK